jgi:putative cardiolipin synthase
VLAFGAVIKEASAAYDTYWNHDAVYPVKGVSDLLPAETLDQLRTGVPEVLGSYRDILTSYPLKRQDWAAWSEGLAGRLVAGTAHFLQDDPVHIDGESYRLVDMITYLKDPAQEEFILASPYLIPVGPFLDILQESVDAGIRVRILTNSLGSTNHTLVNSHYKKYRRPILETGTELHEFNHNPPPNLRSYADTPPVSARFISLHAKVFITDRKRCFIGSLNFDPRALVINSENGLLIESKELALELTESLEDIMAPDSSWQVSIDPDNRLVWRTDKETTYSQPGRNFWQHISDFFGRLLPVESQL